MGLFSLVHWPVLILVPLVVIVPTAWIMSRLGLSKWWAVRAEIQSSTS